MAEHLTDDSPRADTVRQVTRLAAASAITAPKSGGQLFKVLPRLGAATTVITLPGCGGDPKATSSTATEPGAGWALMP